MSDYGDENPLLMDYYGFPPNMYKLKFKSKGDTTLSKRIVELYKEVCIEVTAIRHPLTYPGWISISRDN